MNILITGGSGFIGKNLVENLSNKKSYNIFCLVRDETRNSDKIFLKEKKAQIIKADLCDWKRLDMISGKYDIVIHLAAELMGQNYNRESYEKNNITGTENLVKFCIKKKVKKIIYLSSAGVYGIAKNITEKNKINPSNIYEKTKYEGERVIEKSKIAHSILRPSLVYGKYDKRFTKHFCSKKIVYIVGNGKNSIQPVEVSEVITVILKELNYKNRGYPLLVVGKKSIRLIDFIKEKNPNATIIRIPIKIAEFVANINDSLSKLTNIYLPFTLERFEFFDKSRTYRIR